MSIIIKQLNPEENPLRTYMIINCTSKEAVIIDPALKYVDNYINYIKGEKIRLKYTIDTHTHADHDSASGILKNVFDCKYIMHSTSYVKCVDIRVEEASEIWLSKNVYMKFMYTPGHSKDSICIIIDNYIFTGDTLFRGEGGVGRNDLLYSNIEEHYNSLINISKLNEKLIICAAHDYFNLPPSTLSDNLKTNPVLYKISTCTQKEFIEYCSHILPSPLDWMNEIIDSNINCSEYEIKRDFNIPLCEMNYVLSNDLLRIKSDSIEYEELKQILEYHKYIILDVREKFEIEKVPLILKKGVMINIPLRELERRIYGIDYWKNEFIIVICASGLRASYAAKIIKSRGFSKVYFLNGGLAKNPNLITTFV